MKYAKSEVKYAKKLQFVLSDIAFELPYQGLDEGWREEAVGGRDCWGRRGRRPRPHWQRQLRPPRGPQTY
jgi:hypothetical protein